MGNSINAFVYAQNDIVKSNIFPEEPRAYYDEFVWYFEGIYARYLTRRARVAPIVYPSIDEDDVSTQASDGD